MPTPVRRGPGGEGRPLEDLPFDQYQRYGALRLAADALRTRLGRPLRLLDVGDSSGLAARVCPDDRTCWLDPTGAGDGRYVQADGARLPFGDGAFDLVACLDMLEHVAPAERAAVVTELHRVAANAVVLAVPVSDDGAPACEEALAEHVWALLGGEQRQLTEHAAHGLPTRAEIGTWVDGPGWTRREWSSGLLDDWLAMMVTKHALVAVGDDGIAAHHALDRRYNGRHGPVDPAAPAYRHVVVSARGAASGLLDAVAAALPPMRADGDPTDIAVARTLLVAAHARRYGAPLRLEAYVDADPRALARASSALDRAVRGADGLTPPELRDRLDGYAGGRVMRALVALARLRQRVGW